MSGDEVEGLLLARLRRATRPIHDRLDALGSPATIDAYGDFLAGMFAGHAAVAPLLKPEHDAVVDRLAADLRDLGRDGPEPSPPPDVTAGLPGVRYVVLGSRFGAAAMLPTVRDRLPNAPTRFLKGDPQDATTWRSFKASLAEVPVAHHPAAERAAVATFKIFERALARAMRSGDADPKCQDSRGHA